MQDSCILRLRSAAHMLDVRSELGCDTCPGRINDMLCSSCSLQSPDGLILASRNPSHQLWFAYLIAHLEELQIESWNCICSGSQP